MTTDKQAVEGVSGETVKIPLSNGEFALVDAIDAEACLARNWCKTEDGYARQTITSNGKKHSLFMHRFVLAVDSLVDHINGNGLDNRRSNLRLATKMQNAWNCFPRDGSSKFKGVSWYSSGNKWRAQITIHKKRKHLGYFISEEDAAAAYDVEAIKHFGEYARLNLLPFQPKQSSKEGV